MSAGSKPSSPSKYKRTTTKALPGAKAPSEPSPPASPLSSQPAGASGAQHSSPSASPLGPKESASQPDASARPVMAAALPATDPVQARPDADAAAPHSLNAPASVDHLDEVHQPAAASLPASTGATTQRHANSAARHLDADNLSDFGPSGQQESVGTRAPDAVPGDAWSAYGSENFPQVSCV